MGDAGFVVHFNWDVRKAKTALKDICIQRKEFIKILEIRKSWCPNIYENFKILPDILLMGLICRSFCFDSWTKIGIMKWAFVRQDKWDFNWPR